MQNFSRIILKIGKIIRCNILIYMKLVGDMQQNLVDAFAKQTFFVLTILLID
jgi:hypothetical protein